MKLRSSDGKISKRQRSLFYRQCKSVQWLSVDLLFGLCLAAEITGKDIEHLACLSERWFQRTELGQGKGQRWKNSLTSRLDPRDRDLVS